MNYYDKIKFYPMIFIERSVVHHIKKNKINVVHEECCVFITE